MLTNKSLLTRWLDKTDLNTPLKLINLALEGTAMNKKLSQYIKQMTNAVAGDGLRPCIKQQVYAMLVTADGLCFFGANWMTNGDLTVCPRVTAGSKSGQDYHFCTEICNQDFHAERAAIDAANNYGCTTEGGVIYLLGHTYCCKGCYEAMLTAGIFEVVIIDTDRTITLYDNMQYEEVNWN